MRKESIAGGLSDGRPVGMPLLPTNPSQHDTHTSYMAPSPSSRAKHPPPPINLLWAASREAPHGLRTPFALPITRKGIISATSAWQFTCLGRLLQVALCILQGAQHLLAHPRPAAILGAHPRPEPTALLFDAQPPGVPESPGAGAAASGHERPDSKVSRQRRAAAARCAARHGNGGH